MSTHVEPSGPVDGKVPVAVAREQARRVVFFGAALLVFVLSTVVSFLQKERLDPTRPVTPRDADYWLRPVEFNAELRLPALPGEPAGVSTAEDGSLWVWSTDGRVSRGALDGSWHPAGRPFPGCTLRKVLAQGPLSAAAHLVACPPSTASLQQVGGALREGGNGPAELGSQSRWARTTDGGSTWAEGPQPEGSASPPRAVVVDGAVREVGTGRPLTRRSGAFTGLHWISESFAVATSTDGTLRRTEDGGASWTRAAGPIVPPSGEGEGADRIDRSDEQRERPAGRVPGGSAEGARPAALRAVVMVTAEVGYAVGDEGLFLTTVDGGASWTWQVVPAPPGRPDERDLDGATQSGSTQAYPRGSADRPDEVGAAAPQADPVEKLLRDDPPPSFDGAAAASPESGEASEAANEPVARVPVRRDGDRPPPWARPDLFALAFQDANTGWVGGEAGALLRTEDGGRTWTWVAQGYWAEDGRGVVSDPRGLRLDFRALLARSGRLLAAGGGRTPWSDVAGGALLLRGDSISSYEADWTVDPGPKPETLLSLSFPSQSVGWAVGPGAVLLTEDGGSAWRRVPLPVDRADAPLRAVHAWNANRAVVVGDGGLLLRTEDAGKRWIAAQLPDHGAGGVSRPDLLALAFSPLHPGSGMVVGDLGYAATTTDGGRSWSVRPRHGVSPPRWYWAALGLVGLLLIPALRAPRLRVELRESVADVLVSDRPLRPDDPDPLGFEDIALGISRFIRNESTQPPLTLAITGEWGTGKSSLMNLLHADLERFGYKPVWFNAWHHQGLEKLLAAMIESVRAYGVPGIATPGGLLFRAKLLWIRSRRTRALLVPVAGAAGLAIAYALAVDDPLRSAEADVTALLEPLTTWFTGPPTEGDDRPNLLLRALSALGAFMALLVPIARGIRAFGADPAALVAGLRADAKISDYRAQTGFRFRFAREFRDVTRALRPRRMVLLIDDLDRCRPGNVLEVLEAVNFLVSSGDCFVVMGIDRLRVERAVGLGFKDEAGEFADEGEDPREQRRGYAHRYLEKLINVEVRVPRIDAERSRALLAAAEVDTTELTDEPAWVLALRGLPALLRRRGALLVSGLVFLIGLTWGHQAFRGGSALPAGSGETDGLAEAPPAEVLTTDEGVVMEAAEAPPVPLRGESSPTAPRVPPPAVAARPVRPQAASSGYVDPPAPDGRAPSLYLLLGLLVFGLGVMRLGLRPDPLVRDSPEFVHALQRWHPLLTCEAVNPRTLKRFLNRVRFLAMRARRMRRDPTTFDRLVHRLWDLERRLRKEPVPDPLESARRAVRTEPTESVLVALAGLDQLEEGLVLAPDWRDRAVRIVREKVPAAEREATCALIARITDSQRAAYLSVTGELAPPAGPGGAPG